MGSGDSPGLQNRRTASLMSSVRSTRTRFRQSLGSFAELRISARGSDAAQTPQLQNRRAASLMSPVRSTRTRFRQSSGSFAALRISPAVSRSQGILRHAQDFGSKLLFASLAEIPRYAQDFACGLPLTRDPSPRSGFRQQAPAGLLRRLAHAC